MMISNVSSLFLLFLSAVTIFSSSSSAFQIHNRWHHKITVASCSPSSLPAVKVWLEEAEKGFVDEDENLMTGEICLRAVKAFASNSDDDDDETSKQRFLCAGALVQRPGSNICDVWMADSSLDEANIQLQGAVLVLDDLFGFHLKRSNACDLENLVSNFIVQCGRIESEYHCASYMSARFRGFRPLKDLWRLLEDSESGVLSCESSYKYVQGLSEEDEDPDAMMFDVHNGLEKYNSRDLSSHDALSIMNILQRVSASTSTIMRMNQTESVLE